MTHDESKPGTAQHSTLDLHPAPFAWQPLTPRGVAAFATASLGRLCFVQLVVALLASTTVVWFLHHAWVPTVQEAINHLPAHGDIHGGQLDWRGDAPARLAEGLFLGFVVDLNHSGEVGRMAHVQVELGKADLKVCSLFGCVTMRYPAGWVVALNRTALEPRWGAWQPAILAAAFGITALLLMVSWGTLATLYCVPAWIIAWYKNRDLSLRKSWKLAAAAMLPGALLLAGAVLFYGLILIDLIRLCLCAALHFVLGWIYLVISPLFLPRRVAGVTGNTNPFSGASPGTETSSKPHYGR